MKFREKNSLNKQALLGNYLFFLSQFTHQLPKIQTDGLSRDFNNTLDMYCNHSAEVCANIGRTAQETKEMEVCKSN